MLVDDSVLGQDLGHYDIVVVGAGAAGLTLAKALGDAKRRVLVLEAGGVKETRLGRDSYQGKVADTTFHHPPLDTYRVRALGGTSRIWGGRCIPFDRIDFEARPWVEQSGWPIPYDEVARYHGAAMLAAEAGVAEDDPATVLPDEPPELVPGLDGPTVRTTLERFSRPTDFWGRYGDLLTKSSAVHVVPGVTVTSVRLTDSGKAVDHLEVVTKADRRHRVRGPVFVLAGGGFEITRLLLASNDVKPAGLGNGGDALGRYYMSHLCTTASVATLRPRGGRVMSDYARDREGIYVRRRLWLTEEAQRSHQLLNTTFRTHLPDPGDPTHGVAILSAMFLAKSFVQREYAAKFSEAPVTPAGYARHLGNVIRQPASLARFGRRWLRDRVLAERKLPSVALPSTGNRFHLEFHAEQSPNPSSRMTLAHERDRTGMPRLHVDWRPTEADIESVRRAHVVLGRTLEETGTGTLAFDSDALADRIRRVGVVGGHHIGTTRMSAGEAGGVVDTECRVYGLDNLYVASASVLPTSGQANPTLTVLALALRLADHLAGRKVRRPELTTAPQAA